MGMSKLVISTCAKQTTPSAAGAPAQQVVRLQKHLIPDSNGDACTRKSLDCQDGPRTNYMQLASVLKTYRRMTVSHNLNASQVSLSSSKYDVGIIYTSYTTQIMHARHTCGKNASLASNVAMVMQIDILRTLSMRQPRHLHTYYVERPHRTESPKHTIVIIIISRNN
jgi:hypothetical protein